MNRRDLIKSAVALAIYGPRFPARAQPITTRSAASVAAAAQGSQAMPFPRIAIVGIAGDQGYGWQTLGTYLGQVGSNAISSSGYFPSSSYVNPVQWLGRFDLVMIGGVWEQWTTSGGRDRADLVEAIKQILLPIGTSPLVFDYVDMEDTGWASQPSYNNIVPSESWYLYSVANGSGANNLVNSSVDGAGYYEVNWAVAWPTAQDGTAVDTSFVPSRVTAPDGTEEGPTDWAADYHLSLSMIRTAPYSGTASGSIPASTFTDSRWSWPYQCDAPNLDGLMLDEIFCAPYVPGYYDLTNDYPATATTDYSGPVGAWLLRGSQHYFTRMQDQLAKAYPGRTYYNFGNLSSWNYLFNTQYWANSVEGIQDTMHGGLLEACIGASWSIEGQSGWYADITSLQGISDFCLDPKLVVHATRWESAQSYQQMRYGLTTALMSQAYHSYDYKSYDYSKALYYDEYGGNPGTNVPKGYLGNPKGSRPTAAAIGPVWLADFDNGLALCYPRTDPSNTPYSGPVTVTAAEINSYLSTNYSLSFIQGTQNPSLNSGQAMSSVTLQPGGDGVILLHAASSQTVTTVAYAWSGLSGDGISSQSVTRNIAINKGDLLVAWVMGYGSTYPSGVSDGQLGTLGSVGGAEAATSYPSFLKAYWTVATQDYAADSSNQVTASFNPPASHINVIWALYRCSAGYAFGGEIAAVGAAQNAPGSGAGAINTGSADIGSAPAFLVGGTEILGLGSALPTVYSPGWTQDFSDGTDNFSEASILVTSQGNQECQWTAGSNSGGAMYGNVLAAFSVVPSGSSQAVTTVGYKWSGTSGSNVSSQSAARDIAINQGDLLVAWVMGYGANYPASVSDGQLGILTTASSAEAATSYPSFLKTYWAIATQDYAADASNQVTASFGSAASFINVIWAVYRCPAGYVFGDEIASVGAAQNSPGTGAGAINTGSSDIPSAPAFLVAGTEILGLGTAMPMVYSSGWTQDFADGADNFAEASIFLSAQGTQECQWTAGSNSGGAMYGNVLAGFSVIAAG